MTVQCLDKMQVSFETTQGVNVNIIIMSQAWIYKLVYTFCEGKLANLGIVKFPAGDLVVVYVIL